MFNINSAEGIAARNAILVALGADPIPTRPALKIKRVIYNNPATVVYWSDGTKTVVKCQPKDEFNFELGLLLAICKRVCGNNGSYNDLLRKFVPGYGNKCHVENSEEEPKVEKMREELDSYCKGRSCIGCPLDHRGFECGRGHYFTELKGSIWYMTDESIIKHYRTMKKGEHTDGHK